MGPEGDGVLVPKVEIGAGVALLLLEGALELEAMGGCLVIVVVVT